MENPLFFKNRTYKLFGVLHQPEGAPSPMPPAPCTLGIVFCHPFAEEKLIAHRVILNLARNLTNDSVYCLRFDYMGHGDSEGNFEDATVDSRKLDIQCALTYLREHTGVTKIGLLGFRFGATMAALCADSTIDFLILISPITKGKPYIDRCMRSNLTTQMATYKKIIKNRNALINDLMAGNHVNIDGYLLTKQLYQQMADINLLTMPLESPQNVLLIQVAKKENQPMDEEVNQLSVMYKNNGSAVTSLNVHDHSFWTDTKQYTSLAHTVQERVLHWMGALNPSLTE